MPVLQASGIGSGLDVVGIVNQLVAAERTPIENRINKQESLLNSQISAFGTVKSALDSLQTALADLKSASAFQQRSATAADATVATATASTDASLGTYSLTVNTLATSHKLRSGAFANTTDVVGSGTLTIEVGKYDSVGDTFTASTTTPLTITAAVDDTLADIRDKINSADIGVTATIINDGTNNFLTFSSDNTGTANTIKISAVDNDGNNTDAAGLSQLTFDPVTAGVKNITQTAATDATFNLDGIDITSSSNTVTTAITGVTLQLLKAGGATTDITIGADSAAAKDKITKFVDAYNNVIKTINTASRYSEGASSQGPLLSDSMVRNLKSRLQSIVGDVSSNGGAFVTLTQLGYATNTTDGTLFLKDSAALDAAIASNFDDVGLIAGDVATKVDDLIDPYLGLSGLFQDRTDGLQKQLDDLQDQRDRLDRRIELVHDRYTRQFSALDALVSSMNSTMSFLSQQLASLPGART